MDHFHVIFKDEDVGLFQTRLPLGNQNISKRQSYDKSMLCRLLFKEKMLLIGYSDLFRKEMLSYELFFVVKGINVSHSSLLTIFFSAVVFLEQKKAVVRNRFQQKCTFE